MFQRPAFVNQFRQSVFNKLLKKLETNNLDLVFGSRYEKNAHTFDDDAITGIGNYCFTFLGNFLMKFNIKE